MHNTLTRRQLLRRTAAIVAMHAPLLDMPRVSAAQRPEPVNLHHLHLIANNLNEQATFYRDILKVPVHETNSAVHVTIGKSQITFTSDSTVDSPFYHFAFTIPENQLENAMAWLEPNCPIASIKGSRRKVMNFRNWNAHSCYFFDPAGNILEFIAHHDLENGTRKKFDSNQLLHVSEIGLVAPDVPTFEAQITKYLGLTPYISSSEVFSPLGDVNGLLIVVQQDRIWLPTVDVPAGVFPTDIVLGGTQNQHTCADLPYKFRSLSGSLAVRK